MAEKRIYPSRLWYPQNLPAQAVWWANFAAQLAIVGASLGLTPAEIASVQDTATVMAFYADARAAANAWLKGIPKHINDIRELAVGEPTPAWPANPASLYRKLSPLESTNG